MPTLPNTWSATPTRLSGLSSGRCGVERLRFGLPIGESPEVGMRPGRGASQVRPGRTCGTRCQGASGTHFASMKPERPVDPAWQCVLARVRGRARSSYGGGEMGQRNGH